MPDDTPEVSIEIVAQAGQRRIAGRLLSPPQQRLAEKPLLLLALATDRETTLTMDPYAIPGRCFLEQGHRTVSFDLPGHGRRVDAHGEGITNWRNAFVAGEDPFRVVVEEARAVLDRCVDLGLGAPGRMAVCGTSRGGYMALRVLAADDRLYGGAGFAPVTDWRRLKEFAADIGRPDVAALRLSEFAGNLTAKAVYLAIGGQDERVGTESCRQLHQDLLAAKARAGRRSPPADFYCTSDPGHGLTQEWYRRGAAFLLHHGSEPAG